MEATGSNRSRSVHESSDARGTRSRPHARGSRSPASPDRRSPKAAAKLAELLAAEKKDPATTGLRLGVQGGGCSGLTYIMEFNTKRETDRVFSLDGVQVFVDPKSILYMSGSVLDYAEGLMGSGFSIKNPNVKGSCGCGHSFTT